MLHRRKRRQRFCIWGGGLDWVWIGSTEDRVRQSQRNFSRVIFKFTASTEKLMVAIQRAHLSILDFAQDLGCDDQTPVSWEVERERFMRGLGTA